VVVVEAVALADSAAAALVAAELVEAGRLYASGRGFLTWRPEEKSIV
jgi:hypothetical protein